MSALAAEAYAATACLICHESESEKCALKPEGERKYKTIVCWAERLKRELAENKERSFPKQKKTDKEPVLFIPALVARKVIL